MSENIEKNLKPQSQNELIREARDFSPFEFTYENPSSPRGEIDHVPEVKKHYKEFDEFINQAYLRGKKLNDPDFVEKVFQAFRNTHQSGGFGMEEFLEKTGEPEVLEFSREYGQEFLKELVGGGETEIYQQFSCKYKTE